MKKIGVLIVLCAGVAVAVATAARPATTDGTLLASVGPGFSISLTNNGAAVKNLAPGTYTISVDDKSDFHNFHLFGPGVDQATEVETSGTTTWTVTFQNGTYTFQCDAHSTQLHGTFAVGTAPPTTTTTPTPTPPPPLKAKATLKAVHRALTATGTASRRARITVGLYKGVKKLAAKTGTGTKISFHYVAKAPGKYVVREVAKAGATTVKSSASLKVK